VADGVVSDGSVYALRLACSKPPPMSSMPWCLWALRLRYFKACRWRSRTGGVQSRPADIVTPSFKDV
jgi:hypothetical protein